MARAFVSKSAGTGRCNRRLSRSRQVAQDLLLAELQPDAQCSRPCAAAVLPFQGQPVLNAPRPEPLLMVAVLLACLWPELLTVRAGQALRLLISGRELCS